MTKRVATERRTPARDSIQEDARQTLTMLRGCRFLRDSEARKYSERLAGRLLRRGYQRGMPRVRAAEAGGR